MDKMLKGLTAYDPEDTKLILHFSDGCLLEPYGYDVGEHLWVESGVIYLKIQSTSDFTSRLLAKMIELDTNFVKVQLSSKNPNIDSVLAQFNGLDGEVKVSRVGLRSSHSIPSNEIKIILTFDA